MGPASACGETFFRRCRETKRRVVVWIPALCHTTVLPANAGIHGGAREGDPSAMDGLDVGVCPARCHHGPRIGEPVLLVCVAYGQAFRHHSYALEDLIRRRCGIDHPGHTRRKSRAVCQLRPVRNVLGRPDSALRFVCESGVSMVGTGRGTPSAMDGLDVGVSSTLTPSRTAAPTG